MVNQLLNNVKENVKNQSARLLRPFGIHLLSTKQSEAVLHDYRIYRNESQRLTLNRVADLLSPDKVLFAPKEVTTAPAYVWQYPVAGGGAHLLRNGGLRLGDQVLNTDFGNSALLKDALKFDKRQPVRTDTLIAPWSHYWWGYHDYVVFVAAKLYRIKNVLPASTFADALVAYPLLKTPFERDWLDLLGCRPEQVIDSRTTDVRFARCVLGNSGNWFYPNVADLVGLKGYLATKVDVPAQKRTRLYIRRAGRRRVVNEEALMQRLEAYGFTIVEDQPRSVADQYRLYNNAQFILGPHGASFANILWCEPGTHLFELFPKDYMPEFFRYMAQVLGLRYSAYCHGDGSAARSHFSSVDQDVYVSVDELESRLNQVLAAVE